jgi:2-oxoglutarate ferredoxin oxidoreductase subunit alpha
MTRKRYFRKLELLRQEIEPPSLEGHPAPELLLIGYGSTYGVLKEVVAALAENHAVALLHFSEVWPFPPPDRFDYAGIMRRAARCICVENNASGQFARLLRAEIGFDCLSRINRYDGRPFTIEGLLGEIDAYLG